MTDLRSKLEQAMQDVFTDEKVLAHATAATQAISQELVDEMRLRVETDLAYNLAWWVERMFDQAVKAMLEGNEGEMRRALSCEKGGYTGRERHPNYPESDHPVIHGKLFETGAIALRKQVVDAHEELLKNERILDLEDQVRSLVAQVNVAERRHEELIRRLR